LSSAGFLATRSDGAALLSRLQDAALADEEGQALAREIAALGIRADSISSMSPYS